MLTSDDIPTRVAGAVVLWTRAVALGLISGVLLVGVIFAVASWLT